MLTVSFIDLIPESYHLLTSVFKNFPSILILSIFLVIGIIFSILIDKFLPSTDSSEIKNKKLFHLGFVSMLAIVLHNIPEDCSYHVSHNIMLVVYLIFISTILIRLPFVF